MIHATTSIWLIPCWKWFLSLFPLNHKQIDINMKRLMQICNFPHRRNELWIFDRMIKRFQKCFLTFKEAGGLQVIFIWNSILYHFMKWKWYWLTRVAIRNLKRSKTVLLIVRFFGESIHYLVWNLLKFNIIIGIALESLPAAAQPEIEF